MKYYLLALVSGASLIFGAQLVDLYPRIGVSLAGIGCMVLAAIVYDAEQFRRGEAVA